MGARTQHGSIVPAAGAQLVGLVMIKDGLKLVRAMCTRAPAG
jgi:hypothetical protein